VVSINQMSYFQYYYVNLSDNVEYHMVHKLLSELTKKGMEFVHVRISVSRTSYWVVIASETILGILMCHANIKSGIVHCYYDYLPNEMTGATHTGCAI